MGFQKRFAFAASLVFLAGAWSNVARAVACEGQSVDAAFVSVALANQDLFVDMAGPVTEPFVRRAMKVKDVANGYLELDGKDIAAPIQVALFRSKKGDVLAAVVSGMSVERVSLFRCKGGAWSKFSDPLLSEPSPETAAGLYRSAGLIGKKLGSAFDGKALTERFLEEYAGSTIGVKLPRKGRRVRLVSLIDDKAVYGAALGEAEFDGDAFHLAGERR